VGGAATLGCRLDNRVETFLSYALDRRSAPATSPAFTGLFSMYAKQQSLVAGSYETSGEAGGKVLPAFVTARVRLAIFTYLVKNTLTGSKLQSHERSDWTLPNRP
jgi:hypothetical protein